MLHNTEHSFAEFVYAAVGKPADYTVFDMNEEYTVDSREFVSMGKSSPFEGMTVKGRCLETVVGGKTVWKYEK